MTPGRSPFMKTGYGIPSALLQTNVGTGEDIKAEAKRKAEEDAKAKLTALGKNEGGSTNVREVQGTATVTRKGQPVEKQAQTPKEIAAWSAAKAKAESEGRPFGEKYKTQTATETVKLSDTGTDKPKEEKQKSNNNYWHKSNTNTKSGFGGGSSWGVTTAESYIGGAGKRKQAADTNPEVIKGGAPFATGEDNEFYYQQMTDQEQKLWNNHRLTQDSNPFGKDPVKRQAWLNEVEGRLDADLKEKSDRKAAADARKATERTAMEARQKEKADKLTASKAQVAAAKAAKLAAIQAKKKNKTPAQMRKR